MEASTDQDILAYENILYFAKDKPGLRYLVICATSGLFPVGYMAIAEFARAAGVTLSPKETASVSEMVYFVSYYMYKDQPYKLEACVDNVYYFHADMFPVFQTAVSIYQGNLD